MNVNQRLDRLQKSFRQLADARQRRGELDRCGLDNLAKIEVHPEGTSMLTRLLELAPNLDEQMILASPEACELACRIFEIVAAGDYLRLPCPGIA